MTATSPQLGAVDGCGRTQPDRLPPLRTCSLQRLAHHDRPDTVTAWLNKPTAPDILHELAADGHPLTHASLNQLPDAKPLRHLRALLVATDALPPRAEHLARLEQNNEAKRHWPVC